MHRFIHSITDRIATKKGAWISIMIWVLLAVVLSMFAPSSKDYAVNNVSQLYPDISPSVIASNKVDEYFAEDDGIPAIFVFEAEEDAIKLGDIQDAIATLADTD